MPHVPFRDEFEWDCGVATALSVLHHYGKKANWDEVCSGLSASQHRATHPANFESLFWRYDLKVIAGQWDIPDLVHQTKRGRVMITPVDFGDGGHYVGVWDVTRAKVYYQNCEIGTEEMSVFQFDQIWDDYDTHGNRYDHWGIVVYQ